MTPKERKQLLLRSAERRCCVRSIERMFWTPKTDGDVSQWLSSDINENISGKYN